MANKESKKLKINFVAKKFGKLFSLHNDYRISMTLIRVT